ncbi:MAG: protein-L-isoaspartate(D-aspartate) O-methyltransferase [Melioribacteraceae bacterium]|nr:protein-L-isoaspartate(D-aspartate) O-methyltransferase [Melioribacteraceae bacterium]
MLKNNNREKDRRELVDLLIGRGIKDEKVLSAILKVERHKFVLDAMQIHAYKDIALPIGSGQTISQPFTVAFMTEKLNVRKGMKVLEIGTGSGYQAAILMEMGAKVFSIERQHDLFNNTRALFEKNGWRVHMRCSDGTIGWDDYAPYDGIIVTAGGPSIPMSLLKQLAVGGRLVIPVGDREDQVLKIIYRATETEFDEAEVPEFKFVPLIGRNGWKKA